MSELPAQINELIRIEFDGMDGEKAIIKAYDPDGRMQVFRMVQGASISLELTGLKDAYKIIEDLITAPQPSPRK